jgi:hypothetical protein
MEKMQSANRNKINKFLVPNSCVTESDAQSHITFRCNGFAQILKYKRCSLSTYTCCHALLNAAYPLMQSQPKPASQPAQSQPKPVKPDHQEEQQKTGQLICRIGPSCAISPSSLAYAYTSYSIFPIWGHPNKSNIYIYIYIYIHLCTWRGPTAFQGLWCAFIWGGKWGLPWVCFGRHGAAYGEFWGFQALGRAKRENDLRTASCRKRCLKAGAGQRANTPLHFRPKV